MKKKVDILKKKGINLNQTNKKGLNYLMILLKKKDKLFYDEYK